MDVPPWRRTRWLATAIGSVLLLSVGAATLPRTAPRSSASAIVRPRTSPQRRPSDLPLPSRVSVARFEETLFAFLNARRYAELGWHRDKGVRDTGPFLEGKSYGTHPAVRVYYSPGVIRWLIGGRVGKVADGEMIVKEQYASPAIRHEGKSEGELWDALESWTVMVKDSSASHDGWFWSNPAKGQRVVDNHRYPFAHPLSGFGHACIRCHAATRSPGAEPAAAENEFTFASLRNIEGFPGTPIQFPCDDSWRHDAAKGAGDKSPTTGHSRLVALPTPAPAVPPMSAERRADPNFLTLFANIPRVRRAELSLLPPVTHDWVVRSRDPGQEFVTSNQCMSCHAGLVAPFGPTMFVPTGKSAQYAAAGWDVSPYGEWRWTPMGLAGRDPVVYAQIESEVQSLCDQFRDDPAVAGNLCATLADTCLRCHGAMGKRQFASDHPESAATFSLDHVSALADPAGHPGQGPSRYGALARDGVGCMVCHRMQPRVQPPGDHRPYLQYFLETSTTGNFHLGAKGEIYGPYKDHELAPYAMEHATGLKPRQSTFLQSSQLCGTCHTVALPNVDRPRTAEDPDPDGDELTASEAVPLFRKFHHHVEQATYLEWINSEYENEIHPNNPRAKSCQDCHMARGLKDERHAIDIPQLRTKIAAIQDATYPDAENLAPRAALDVRTRDSGYRRHNFSGLNVFLIEMFNQCDDVLGVPKTDFMTGSTEGIAHAVESFLRTAREDVATLSVNALWRGPDRLTARVVVRNKVGHRFPSGVGFRRAFLELAVIEKAEGPRGDDRIVWASGRTNDLGMLVGGDGQPLATESFARDAATGRQCFQGHHEVITSPEQVQVYETLLHNAKGEFTTSFVRSCETVKDNRLLPRGWRREGPGAALRGRYLRATHPGSETLDDPCYQDGSGTDEVTYRITLPRANDPARLLVRATLYYQALPPYFLRNLFETAPDGPATRRLHYLCSHLDLDGTPIAGWKLPITSAACSFQSGP